MELLAVVAEQVRDVLQALRVPEADALALVCDRPDVALALEDRGRCGSRRAFRCGRCARRLAEAGRGLEIDDVRFERLHPDLARRGERLRGERGRPLAVAGPVPCDEHARVVVLGVRDPDASTDPRVHLESVLEVPLGLVVARQYGRESAEPTRDRPPGGGDGAEDDAAISVGKEEIVEDRRPPRVAEKDHQVGQSRDAVQPRHVPRDIREILGGERIEFPSSLSRLPGDGMARGQGCTPEDPRVNGRDTCE